MTLIRKVVTKMFFFKKIFRTTGVSMATHSLNLVTMATSKNYIKSVFDTYKEGGNKI